MSHYIISFDYLEVGDIVERVFEPHLGCRGKVIDTFPHGIVKNKIRVRMTKYSMPNQVLTYLQTRNLQLQFQRNYTRVKYWRKVIVDD